jgi:hypothetical protein
MPRLGAGETEEQWVKRCVSGRQKEGSDKSVDQSVAICASQWRDKHGGKKPAKKK